MANNRVFFDVVMSLDGFTAPEGMNMAHADDPGYKQWLNKWKAPFHTPVFVLTHEVRKPWERPGGTTFFFVNDNV